MAATQLTAEGSKRIIETEDFQLEYYEHGSGYPVIMLHGAGPGATGWSNFSSNIGPLGQKYHAIALTLPGWGESSEQDGSEPLNTVNARAVAQLMDKLDYKKAALVGNSMGGMTVLDFLLTYPGRCSHSIMMGTPAPGVNIFQPGGGHSEGLKILFECYQDPSPENFRQLVRVMVYDSSFATEDLFKARSDAAMKNPAHLKNWLKLMPRGPSLPNAEDLAEIETPALIIHGRDDRVVMLEAGLRLLAIFPNSRLVIFNRCGHWAQIEHADEFNWLIDKFIEENPGS